MSTNKWRGRAEWATLVAVIFIAGYVAQVRADDATQTQVTSGENKIKVVVDSDSNVKNAKAKRSSEVAVEAIAIAESDDKDGPVRVQVRMVGPDGKDVDIDRQPAVKVLRRLIKVKENDGNEEEQEIELRLAVEPPSHFLGIHGSGVDPILAKHLKLEKGQGVLVEMVLEESPAKRAGLQEDDILLTANGKSLEDLEDLVEIIREGKGEEISFDLIREGKKMALTVKPVKRSDNLRKMIGDQIQQFDPKKMEDLRVWVEKMQDQGSAGGVLGDPMPHAPHALRLRTLGPGMIVDGGVFGVANMPGNLSVSITRSNDEPAKIKIKQGDKTWEFDADDEKAIEKLPDAIRKFVEPMHGNVNIITGKIGAGDPNLSLPPGMPPHIKLNDLSGHEWKLAEPPFKEMMERMEEMESRLEELRDEIRQMHGEGDKESL